MSGYSDDEVRWLIRFAFANFPHDFASSILVEAGRVCVLDASLVDSLAGAHAAARLPSSTEDPTALETRGWRPLRIAPALAASMVLGKLIPITAANVMGLRLLLTPRDATSLEIDLIAQAGAFLRRMKQHIESFVGDGAKAFEDLQWEWSGIEAWYLGAARHDSREFAWWIELAIERHLHKAWDTKQVDAVLTFLGNDCNNACAALLQRASFHVAETCLLGNDASCRSAALERVQALCTDRPRDATNTLHRWASKLTPRPAPRPELLPVRGALGFFSNGRDLGRPVEQLHPEHAAWMRNAPASERLNVAVDAIARGYEVALIKPLLDESDCGRLELDVIAAFETRASLHLAVCLAELRSPRALEALVRGLSGEDPLATYCEYACAFMPSDNPLNLAQAMLLDLTHQKNAAIVLRATRVLGEMKCRAAGERLQELAVHENVLIRWVALRGLLLLGEGSGNYAALRANYDLRLPPEQRMILELVARNPQTDDDVQWVLDRPVLVGVEESPLERVAWLARVPDRWLDEQIDKLRAGVVSLDIFDADHFRPIAKLLVLRMAQRGLETDPLTRELKRWGPPIAGNREPQLGSEGSREDATHDAEDVPTRAPPLADSACFSVVAPGYVAPCEAFVIEVFVHAKEELASIPNWSAMPYGRRFTAGPRKLASSTEVEVTVEVPGIFIERPVGTLHWDGALGMLQVPCKMPLDAMELAYTGRAVFRVASITIAEANFLITLGPTNTRKTNIVTHKKWVRSAFASYASSDRERMLARVQGMQKIAPFIDVFIDVLSLRSGDRWMEVVRDEIRARDVLFLFWSHAASQSHYVDVEWRTALAEHGLDGVDPVPLESPKLAPPPEELRALHFHDWTLTLATHEVAPK